MSTAKGTSSSVPPQGGSSGKSKRQADINQEEKNIPGPKGLSTPLRNNNQQPYNGQVLTSQIKTVVPKVSI